MESKNTFIALTLIMLVWMGFTYMSPPQGKSAPAVKENVVETKAVSAPDSAIDSKDATQAIDTVDISNPVNIAAGTDIVIDNGLCVFTFSDIGGSLKSIEYKDYKNSTDVDSPSVVIMASEDPRFFNLVTNSTGSFKFSSTDLFTVTRGTSGTGEDIVVFSNIDNSGNKLEKKYVLSKNAYDIELVVTVSSSDSRSSDGQVILSLVNKISETKSLRTFVGPVINAEGIDRVKLKKLKDSDVKYDKTVKWFGYTDKYFASVVIPVTGIDQLKISQSEEMVVSSLYTKDISLAAGEKRSFKYRLFSGPKDVDLLETYGSELENLIDFGFFGIISKPLLHVLKYFNSVCNNWGLSIIVLTVLIKMLFWPLTQKSYVSMKRMQTLQPEIKKLKDRYKDRERMNKEVMALYKEKSVNPLGGCLPIVIQIPVFFALYKVLMGAIELRHSPFIFWITDLSMKDPYYITPLIMGVTMFLQQKMTPSSMDPSQAKIFLMMPVVFTFLFLNFPAGLVVYWLTNNILTIGQQYMIHRKN